MTIRWLSAPSLLLHTALISCSVSCGTEARVHAQTREPRFEVVSIKRSTTVLPGPVFGNAPGGGGFNMTSGPIVSVISAAYPTRNRDIVGLPDWVRTERYDVVATAKGPGSQEEQQAMLRTLLAERMAFRGHVEQRELAVYELVVAGNPRSALQRLSVDCETYVAAVRRGESVSPAMLPDGTQACGYSMGGTDTGILLTSRGISMTRLADILGSAAGRVVVDGTNLGGDYAFSLTYGLPRTNAALDEPSTVFTALQEQLGLKLQPTRAPIDTLVIDHIERPSEN